MLFSQDAQKKLKRKASGKKPPQTIADVLKKSQETFSTTKKPKVESKTTDKPSKPKFTPGTAKAKELRSAATEGEEDFVRGEVARPANPAPRKDVSHESDVLFGVKPKPQKKVKKTKVEHKEQPEKKEKSLEESRYRAGPLMFTQITVGCKFLASVKMILESDLVLSLPGNLTAYMSVREVSDQIAAVVDDYINSSSVDASALPKLSDMFKVGQLLRTVVVHITLKGPDTKKRLEVSMRPSLVNRGLTKAHLRPGMTLCGSVKSVEEKGYLIDLGMGEDGFLPFKSSGSETRFPVGYPLDLAVTAVARVISLSTEGVSDGLIKNEPRPDLKEQDQALISMDTLLPGMMVQAKLTKALPSGLQMRFLDVLNGTVDLAQLPDALGVNEDPTKVFSEDTANPSGYPVRVVYVDPNFKHVRLSMKPDLLAWKPIQFPPGLKVGDVIKDALVVRVDATRGVTVQLAKGAIQGFAHKTSIAAADREQLSKHFAVGSTVCCRVTGLQLMDGVLNVSLDPDVINQKIFGVWDLTPGQFVEGKVLSVSPAGVMVRLSPQVKGLIPAIHLNDIGEGGSKKFEVDSMVKVRVLSVGEKTGRVVLTAKKTLKNKNLPLLASYEKAMEGFITFGVVVSVKEHGLVVQFFNNVTGFLSIKDLRRQYVIRPDQGIGEAYSVGQLVQVRVVKAQPVQRKLFLALSVSGPTSLMAGMVVAGVVSGAVEEDNKQDKPDAPKLAPRKYLIVTIEGHKGTMGRLESAHLTDHPYFSSRLFRSYPIGTKLESLLVLRVDKDGVMLSAKPSILQAFAAKKFPSNFGDVEAGSILHGYVKNITEHGIFVSFLDNLTGLVPRKMISEQFVASPYDHFQPEQSVRVRVESTDSTTKHLLLNLRASAVMVPPEEEGKLLDSYLIDRARAETQELSEKTGVAVDWTLYPVGSISNCKVLGVKEFGILGELSAAKTKSPVTCLAVRPRHSGADEPDVGSTLPCRVLDQEKVKLIADISFRPELLQPVPSNLKLAVGAKTTAVIQLVKDNHFVLTLPNYSHAPAVALTYTLNMRVNPHSLFQMGTQAEVLVSGETSPGEPVRVVVDANRKIRDKQARGSKSRTQDYFDKSIQRLKHLEVGRVVLVKLLKLQDHSVKVAFSNNDLGVRGQVHISEIEDLPADPKLWCKVKPLATVTKLLGTLAKARILNVHTDKKTSNLTIDLSLRSSALVEDADIPQPITLHRAKQGRIVSAYVVSVEPEEDCAWVDLSRVAKGKIEGLDFAHDRSLRTLVPHTPVRCVVTGVSAGKANLRLAHDGEVSISAGDQKLKGTVVPCQVVQIVPGRGLKVRIDSTDGRPIWGLIHLTDLSDVWTADPLAAFRTGQIVKAFGLDDPAEVKNSDDANAKGQLLMHLSLRASRVSKALPGPNPEILSVSSLTVGQMVKGYVKVTNKKGCWIMLGRDAVARVLIKNLDDGFVRDPEKQFPPGKLVVGRVTDVHDDKVDVSLRSSTLAGGSSQNTITFKDLKEGKIVKGTVTSLQTFGVFIRLLDSSISGLCHISNVSDTPVTDLRKHYTEGDLVRAKILKLEPDKKRVSLGLKSSLLAGEEESDQEAEEQEEKFAAMGGEEGDDEGDEGEEGDEELGEDDDNEPLPIVNVDENDVPPLPIFSFTAPTPTSLASIEEEEDSEEEEEDEEGSGDEEKVNAKSSRRAKASAKKRAETQLNQKEEQLLDSGRAPESAEDFKRLLVSSPDSSYLWIKLMAFHVGITELDKARAVAEQALKTINFREQQEKWNVWIALMNLENLYGTAESLKQVFDRAKERNDPKKITMELCKMFEASEKFTLAEESFEAALKPFGTSGKVWYNYALYFYRRKDFDKARAVLPRALERLLKRKHLKLIRKMAQAEYTLGTTERGRTIMEGVMSSYPKRVDLWSTYVDMEIKAGKGAGFPESVKATIRRLFERIVHLDLKPRKMKFFFKRYLSFEKDHGDAGSQHHVKALAQSYVDKVIKAA